MAPDRQELGILIVVLIYSLDVGSGLILFSDMRQKDIQIARAGYVAVASLSWKTPLQHKGIALTQQTCGMSTTVKHVSDSVPAQRRSSPMETRTQSRVCFSCNILGPIIKKNNMVLHSFRNSLTAMY